MATSHLALRAPANVLRAGRGSVQGARAARCAINASIVLPYPPPARGIISSVHISINTAQRVSRRSWRHAAVKKGASGATTKKEESPANLDLIADISRGAKEEAEDLLQEGSAKATARATDETGEKSELAQRAQDLCRELGTGLVERDREVRLLVLAALAGEHLLLLGPPGTAKSELGRRLSDATGGVFFERLLTRFTVPEELFGPLSMRGLEDDRYERQTAGYLPEADVAFVDEIFKANSAILNSLLTLLNERTFDNGTTRAKVPLACLVGASNELPESEELDALYDRFLIRANVSPVSSSGLRSLAALVASGQAGGGAGAGARGEGGSVMSLEELTAAREGAVGGVGVPEGVIDLLVDLRDHLRDGCEPPIHVSDRRFAKAVSLLQVAAHANGATEVTEYDLLLLENVFPTRPEDGSKVRRFVLESIASSAGGLRAELSLIGLYGRAARALEGGEGGREGVEGEVGELAAALAAQAGGISATLEGGFPAIRRNGWIPEAAALAAAQSLAPPLEEARGKVEGLLLDSLVMKGALREGAPGAVLEQMLPKLKKQYEQGVRQNAIEG